MSAVERVLDAAWLLAVSLWAGGLVTLGAIVAPLVFGIVPMPASADAMTAVFSRFNLVACACAVVVVLCEAARGLTRRPLARLDVLRAVVASLAAALAVVEAVAITPRISALHASGAIRGVGDAGRALDSIHHAAEALAKIELSALVVALALFAATRAPRPVSS